MPIFPLLSEQVAAKAPERVKATLEFAMRLMGFLMMPATVGIILLRYPIIGLILEHGEFTADDTTRTAWALLFLCLGLYAYAGRDTLTRVFYAYHDTRTPVKISVATVVINIGCLLSAHAVPRRGRPGARHDRRPHHQLRGADLAAAAQDRERWASAGRSLAGPGRGSLGGHGRRRSGRSISSCRGPSADSSAAMRSGWRRVSSVGVVIFFLVAWLVRMPELAEITDMLRAVLKRGRSEAGGAIARLTA